MSTKVFLSTVKLSELLNWDVKTILGFKYQFSEKVPLVLFGDFLSKAKIKKIKIEDNKTYSILGVRSYGKGVYINRTVEGKSLKMKTYQQSEKDTLFWCKVDTKNGAFGIIDEELAKSVASTNMTFAKIDTSKALTSYVQLLFCSTKVNSYMDNFVTGTTNRKYIKPNQLLSEIFIPLPSLEEQNKIVKTYENKIKQAEQAEQAAYKLEEEIENYIYSELGIQKQEKLEKKKGLQFVRFCKLDLWGIDKISNQIISDNFKYPIVSLDNDSNLYTDLFRGKSPKYEDATNKFILNQKCNRWNEFELEHAKTVNEKWFNSIDRNAFTKGGDILINSTGEGTIGRSSCIVDNNCKGLIYDSHLLLLRLNFDLVNPLYYTLIFNSDFGQDQVNNIKSAQSTKQTELGVGNLKKIQTPLPPLSKQNEIVEHITALKEQMKALRHQAEQNRQQAIKDFENTIFS